MTLNGYAEFVSVCSVLLALSLVFHALTLTLHFTSYFDGF
jgi:hypothetical protein